MKKARFCIHPVRFETECMKTGLWKDLTPESAQGDDRRRTGVWINRRSSRE